jgi:hypothetical protein
MAANERRGQGLESLPIVALRLMISPRATMIRRLSGKWEKNRLLRIGPVCRDALLAESRSAMLSITGEGNPSAAVHQALLKRACSFKPGISQLILVAEGYDWSKETTLKKSHRNFLHDLLEPFTHGRSSLVNVNSLWLQVSRA